MQSKLIALALVAALALATGGVAAATGASPAVHDSDESTTEHPLPDDYTVEVTDRHDVLSDDDVEAAIQAAWADEELRSYVEDADSVHFDLWAPDADEDRVAVSVASSDEPGQTRASGTYYVGTDTLTDVREPLTADESTTMDLEPSGENTVEVEDGGSLELSEDSETDEPNDEPSETESAVEVPADELITVEYDAENTTVVSDGGSIQFPLPDALA